MIFIDFVSFSFLSNELCTKKYKVHYVNEVYENLKRNNKLVENFRNAMK